MRLCDVRIYLHVSVGCEQAFQGRRFREEGKALQVFGAPISFSMVWARSIRNFGIVESGICIFPLFVVVFSKQKQSSAQNVPDARRISGIYLLVSGKDTHTA